MVHWKLAEPPPLGDGGVGWWFAAPDRENGKRRHAIQFEKQMDSIGGGIGQQGGCAAGWVEVAVRSPPLVVQDPTMEGRQKKKGEKREKAAIDVAESYIWGDSDKETRRMVRSWYREVEEGMEDEALEELWDKMDQCGPEVEEKEKRKWRKEVEEEVEKYKKTNTVVEAHSRAHPGAKRSRCSDEAWSEEDEEAPVAAAPSGARPGGRGGLVADVMVQDSPLHRAHVQPGRDLFMTVAGQDVTERWDKEMTKRALEGSRKVEFRVLNVKTGRERDVAVRVKPEWRLGGEFPTLGVIWRWVTWEEAQRSAEKVVDKKWETSKFMREQPTVAMRRRERRKKLEKGGQRGQQ